MTSVRAQCARIQCVRVNCIKVQCVRVKCIRVQCVYSVLESSASKYSVCVRIQHFRDSESEYSVRVQFFIVECVKFQCVRFKCIFVQCVRVKCIRVQSVYSILEFSESKYSLCV